MARNAREHERPFGNVRCTFDRPGRDDHEIWFSPITTIRFVVDRAIKSRHTANAVLKQGGLPKHF